jgi:Opioid growth factor receptor (OGFr) conserved region
MGLEHDVGDVVAFLEGAGRDAAGRSVYEVLAFGLGPLEARHDFIQWLFPLPTPSRALPDAPVLSASEIESLRVSHIAQTNLAAAAATMGRFYTVTDHWLQPDNHNHLRITRIIKSLRLLVGDAAADGFRRQILSRVEATHAPIGSATREFWNAA